MRVLLVEDSPGDVRLALEAFRTTNTGVQVNVATNGADALAFLRREGDYVDAPRPDLILLDLNLPAMAGSQVLASIKGDEGLKAIPTVILTTVEEQSDIVESYQLYANAYIVKPLELEAFESLIQRICDFWVSRAYLPHESG